MFRKCIFYKKVHFFAFFSLKICIYQKFVVILHRLLKMTPKQTELETQKFEKIMNAKPLYIAHVIGYRIENNERLDLPYYFSTKTAFKKFIAQEEKHNGETFESPMGDWKKTCICEHETFLIDKWYK